MTVLDDLCLDGLPSAVLSPRDLRELRAGSLLLPASGASVKDREPNRTAPRLAIYRRRSFRTDTSVSLGRQLARMEEEVGALNGSYDRAADLFQDDDLSAKGGVFRPGLEQLLRAIQDGRYDGVLVWEYSRWTRNRREGRIATDLMRTAGCELYSLQERWLSLYGPVGFLVEWATDQAAKESEHLSARVTDWHSYTAQAGHHRAAAPWGCVKEARPSPWPDRTAPIQVLVPDEQPRAEYGGNSPAQLVREGVALVVDGLTLGALASRWNEAGYPSPSGGAWRTQTLVRNLLNPQLAGFAMHRGQVVEVDGEPYAPHTAVVDPALHQRLRDEIAVRAQPFAGRSFTESALRGLLRCGRCGGRMHASGGGTRGRGKSYTCARRAAGPGAERCVGNNIAGPQTEAAVWAMVLELLADPDRLPGAVEAAQPGPVRDAAAAAQEQVRSLQARLDKLDDDREGGAYDDSDGERRYARQVARLVAQLEQAQQTATVVAVRRPALAAGLLDPALALEDAVAALTDQQRLTLLHQVLEHVEVLPSDVGRGARWTADRLRPVWREDA